MKRVTAQMETRALMVALASAGWGELAGSELKGVRAVLQGLVNCLPWKSGRGFSTIEEVRTKAGYSKKWTWDCLNFLEELDIVEWRRGGISHDGLPTKSWFEVNKTKLVEFIRAARDKHAPELKDHILQTRERITAYLEKRLERSRRSGHVALSANQLPLRGEVSKTSLPENSFTKQIDQKLTSLEAQINKQEALEATQEGQNEREAKYWPGITSRAAAKLQELGYQSDSPEARAALEHFYNNHKKYSPMQRLMNLH